MGHSHYLKVNGRPIFKVLIPTVFIDECGGNSTLATLRLHQLRAAATAAGVGEVAIGGGWANPAVGGLGTQRPHPEGFMRYNNTKVACPGGCLLKAVPVNSVADCQKICNATSACDVSIWNAACSLQDVTLPKNTSKVSGKPPVRRRYLMRFTPRR